MNKSYFLMILALMIITLPGFTATRAITADGQKVLLEADGKWRAVVSNMRNSQWLKEPIVEEIKIPVKAEEAAKISLKNLTGSAFYKKEEGDLLAVDGNSTFIAPIAFKTEPESNLELKVANGNVLKLYSETMVTINEPEIINGSINKQVFKLSYGEVGVTVSLDGRDILQGKSGEVEVVFNSGLSKLIMDKDLKGEAVVKNGLITLQPENNMKKKTHVSGFYKATFEGDKISHPTQASVIMYDWR